MKRCLQTARKTLDTKAMQARGVKMIVRGDCREILDSQCDFPTHIEDSIKEFSEFDFSHIQESVNKYGPFFVVDFLDNEESKPRLIDASKTVTSSTTKTEISQKYIELLKEGFITGNRIEKNQHVFTRVKRAKESIRKFVTENNIQDGELAIVVHSRFCKAWTSSDVNQETGELINCYRMKNCEVYPYDL
jgi:hypothetical protein